MPQGRLKVSLRDNRRNGKQAKMARWYPTVQRSSVPVSGIPPTSGDGHVSDGVPFKRGSTTLALVSSPGLCSQQNSNTPLILENRLMVNRYGSTGEFPHDSLKCGGNTLDAVSPGSDFPGSWRISAGKKVEGRGLLTLTWLLEPATGRTFSPSPFLLSGEDPNQSHYTRENGKVNDS